MHVRRLVLLAVGRLASRPSLLSSIAVLMALVVFLVWSLLFINHTTLKIEAKTRFVELDIADGGQLLLSIAEGQVLLPGPSLRVPVTEPTKVEGLLETKGAEKVLIRLERETAGLNIRFAGEPGAERPVIGETTIPFDKDVYISFPERQRIAVIVGEGNVTLGEPAVSNNPSYLLLDGSIAFQEHVIGLGRVTVYRQEGIKFKQLSVVDRWTKEPITSRMVLDISSGPIKATVETSVPRNRLAAGVQTFVGGEPSIVAPSTADRLAANPILGLGTAFIAFLLLFAQLVALFLPNASNKSASED